LVNAHGGNNHLIHFFAQTQLADSRDYVVYVSDLVLDPAEEEALKAVWQTTVDGLSVNTKPVRSWPSIQIW
jgi:hypothetical protein